MPTYVRPSVLSAGSLPSFHAYASKRIREGQAKPAPPASPASLLHHMDKALQVALLREAHTQSESSARSQPIPAIVSTSPTSAPRLRHSNLLTNTIRHERAAGQTLGNPTTPSIRRSVIYRDDSPCRYNSAE